MLPLYLHHHLLSTDTGRVGDRLRFGRGWADSLRHPFVYFIRLVGTSKSRMMFPRLSTALDETRSWHWADQDQRHASLPPPPACAVFSGKEDRPLKMGAVFP